MAEVSELAASELAPGTRVLVRGIASRPELNGSVAVVLPPATQAEARKLAEKGRVKITGFPKVLSVKRSILSVQDAEPDWSFANFPNQPELGISNNILDLVRHICRVGCTYRCSTAI